ncbi:hypothetical protein, conserved [Babesia bigemina]|uniref:Uncharacterized protein n=1 Tax=Babesia bigemina TaxID=5866 RepID=A0A061D1U8_BABBI|nr:hypothetical protein, conserved [Babesia bigemina]CDR94102.1 hypothetical protein, conserved [Babesia bigemina]|eukprot:XP_012766288.1 hypothetical protein, conserved [Babesia bigemina]
MNVACGYGTEGEPSSMYTLYQGMDVEEYLRSVREEEARLPEVVAVETTDTSRQSHGKTVEQFERLQKIAAESVENDCAFVMNNNELQFFKTMKDDVNAKMSHAESTEKCALAEYCTGILRSEGDAANVSSYLHNLQDAHWELLFRSPPPDVLKICERGVSFASVQEILHKLANFICGSKGKNIDEKSSRWLFSTLLILDDLHAVQESVSYELQRLKRALSRYIPTKMGDLNEYDPENDEDIAKRQIDEIIIAGHILNLCIIRQHFKQW